MKAEELLIETKTTGSQAQVSYWDGVWEAPVTRVAVCMGVKETGCEQGTWAHTISLQVGIGTGMHVGTAEQSEKH